MALDVTPAGTTADSYATLAEASSYLTFRPESAPAIFEAESAPVREAALVEAARLMNLVRYHRRPYSVSRGSAAQALALPREHHFGAAYEAIVDEAIKRAQVDLAVAIVARFKQGGDSSSSDLAAMRALGLSSASVGTASLNFEGSAGALGDPRIGRLVARGFPSSAAILLAPYVSSTGSVTPDAEDIVRMGEVRLQEQFRSVGSTGSDLIVL